MAREPNRYSRLLEAIFIDHYKPGMVEVTFERTELTDTAARLSIALPKNLGDILYSFRYRTALPQQIADTAGQGKEWVIKSIGRGRYKMVLISEAVFAPNGQLADIKIPDATPGIISRYAFTDEQSLLAKVRYNRLIDIFACLACYSLQNHLRTAVKELGQVEIDEIYVGVDKRGVHYILPVQAKGGRDKIGIVQIEQDIKVCSVKFPQLVCRPIAAQFMAEDTIALFEFVHTDKGIRVASEKHYRLVPPDELTPEELASYGARPE